MQHTAHGSPFPLGATLDEHGVNFAIYSKLSAGMDLLFFDHPDAEQPSRIIPLDPRTNRTFHYWHVYVEGIKAGQHYGFRVTGEKTDDRTQSLEMRPTLTLEMRPTLIDPYGIAVSIASNYEREIPETQLYTKAKSTRSDPHCRAAFKSIVADLTQYDWEGDEPLRRPFSQTVIYEMHVKGLTQNPNSGISDDRRGTYLGVIEKIPHLKELGITAVELLPVFQFDPQDAPFGLCNYWGYSPISFFAPHAEYATDRQPLTALNEFRDMVKALHREGIEVILDVVYNHTAEGGVDGPTFCYKGLQNEAYYLLETSDCKNNSVLEYSNFSGCGNTLNANHAIVRRMILDSLRFWVQEMHVDGFRFDLASILSRDTDGVPQSNPPILWDIETDPILSGTKLIAEAWDAAGLYQVGHFFGDRWKEWNGRFRDDVRSFVKGDRGFAGELAQRFLASPDIYGHRNREPEQSINFITSHDGFTLNDLVSYNVKHNLANREKNRDGHNENLSWNCGHEGATDDPAILRLRRQQAKNLMMINVLSFGVPMLWMGDEVLRSQNGNNNAYCQDNQSNWFDWDQVETNREMFRFVSQLIKFRSELPQRNHQNLTLAEILSPAKIRWHGSKLGQPDWTESSHSVALTIETPTKWYHLIFNAYWEKIDFEIPSLPASFKRWKRIIDTSLDSPQDIQLEGFPFTQNIYPVAPRSSVLLTGHS